MNDAPQLTVFIPVYNGAAFVREAIDSVLGQDGPSFEVLVIDDHSDDGTPQVLQDLAKTDSRIRLLRNDANKGIAACANIAIAQARGRYLMRLDADDVAMPGRNRVQFELLASGAAQVVGSALGRLGGSENFSFPLADGHIKAKFLACANNVANTTSAFDLDFVRSRKLRLDERLRVAEDLHFWIDCMFAGARFANLEQPLVRVRTHAGQTSGRYPAEMLAARHAARSRLLAEWFPAVQNSEREFAAHALAGGSLKREVLLAAIGVMQLLLAVPGPSRHGEDRAEVAAYIERCRNACIAALLPQRSKA